MQWDAGYGILIVLITHWAGTAHRSATESAHKHHVSTGRNLSHLLIAWKSARINLLWLIQSAGYQSRTASPHTPRCACSLSPEIPPMIVLIPFDAHDMRSGVVAPTTAKVGQRRMSSNGKKY